MIPLKLKSFRIALVLSALAGPLPAQWLNNPTPGIPRTSDGKPNLAAPAPRTSDGKPDLSGLWKRPADRYYNNIAVDLKPGEVQPWADALYRQRKQEFNKDSPENLCLPIGAPYGSTTPYLDSKIIQTPALIAILNDNLTYRQIFMDGRELEKDPNPNWMGYSVGRWDGDSLVVESSGFNERTWLDLDGHPHTEALRLTERFRRRDFGHMELQITLNDPNAYAKPWTVIVPMELAVDTEMLEYVCNENEKDRSHMDSTGPTPSEVLVAPATLAKYAGVYEFHDNGGIHLVEITVGDAALFWNQDGAGRQKLVAFSETAFSLSGTSVLFNAEGEFIFRWVEEDMKGVRKR